MSFATREFEIIPQRRRGVFSPSINYGSEDIQFLQNHQSGKQGWVQSTVKSRFQAPGYSEIIKTDTGSLPWINDDFFCCTPFCALD